MKKYVSLLLALLLVFALAACGETAEPEASEAPDEGSALKEAVGVTIPEFVIYVNGVKVTDADMADYPAYEVQTTTVNSSGTESTDTFVGFSLKDVFEVAGVTEFKTVTAVADDGYEVEVDKDMAMDPTTLIAITKNGEQFKSSPWFAPCSSGTTGDYIKGMVAIALDGAKVDLENLDKGVSENTLPELADKTDKVQFADFSFMVNGVEITNETLKDLHIYKMEVTTVNKKGNESTETYTGYKLSDVLEACGVKDFTKVVVVASDGYEVELSQDFINSDLTLIAIEKDKAVGEGGTVWVAPGMSTSSSDYCKLVVEIVAK
ncbi:MAG: hypothetical protein Q4A83_04155 [Bacillota bacterium]|nr:hypothetical protein [Bacillota bacterium]